MRSVCLWSFAVAAAFCLMTPGPASAQPPMTHALIHIKNESNAPATIYYRWDKDGWNNGKWKRTVIERGRAAYFNWRYDGTDQRSPHFLVRFDVNTTGKTQWMELELSRGAAPDNSDPKYGHHFVIKQYQATETRYIDNVTPKAVVKVTDKKPTPPRV
jgi:hypothetical protein